MLTIATLLLLAADPDGSAAPSTPQVEGAPVEAEPRPGPLARNGAALLGAAIPVVLPVGVCAALYFGPAGSNDSVVNNFSGAIAIGATCIGTAIGTAVLLVPLGAWLGHRAAGGEGRWWSALLGGVLGTGAGLALLFPSVTGLLQERESWKNAAGWAFSAISLAAPFAGAMLGVELSHLWKTAHVGLAPNGKSGGMLSLSWEL